MWLFQSDLNDYSFDKLANVCLKKIPGTSHSNLHRLAEDMMTAIDLFDFLSPILARLNLGQVFELEQELTPIFASTISYH